MQTSRRPVRSSLLSLLLLPALAVAITLDCDHIRVNGKAFNLSPLSGPHQVKTSEDLGQSTRDTTYTIDLCKTLTKPHDAPSNEWCPAGTRVCGIEHTTSSIENKTEISAIKAIAGELGNYGGAASGLDPQWRLLTESEAAADEGKEGLRLTLKGGRWPLKKENDKNRKDQQAIIELVCDKERTGLEGEMAPEDKYDSDAISRRDDGTEPSSASLTFVSYPGTNEKIDTLRLNWRTKHACENMKDETDAEQKKHWGFFTWFILIAFLGTAAYLIFGSWLNYTRYGARGWDLLPHGDTIRDVPYLMKDWTRKVVNTVQGGGSRGGYAAV